MKTMSICVLLQTQGCRNAAATEQFTILEHGRGCIAGLGSCKSKTHYYEQHKSYQGDYQSTAERPQQRMAAQSGMPRQTPRNPAIVAGPKDHHQERSEKNNSSSYERWISVSEGDEVCCQHKKEDIS